MSSVEQKPTATIPYPGYAYLRRPHGAPATERATVAAQVPAPPQQDGERKPVDTPPPRAVAQLIMAWLEACEGRRPVQSLRRGPFSPQIVKQLNLGDTLRIGGARLLSLHMQHPCPGQVRFCASVKFDSRVRAIAGLVHDGVRRRSTPHLRRGRGELPAGKWRVEFIQLI